MEQSIASHLAHRLGRRARRLAGAAFVWRPAPAAAWQLVRAGLFDREWYEWQTDRRFGGTSVAVLHYFLRGRSEGWSPHPLFEPEWILGPSSRSWRRDPLAIYRRGRSVWGGPHPWFDDAGWLAGNPAANRHPGGPLGHFLQVATATTVVPVHAGGPSLVLADLLQRLAEPADLIRKQHQLRGRRTSLDWDATRERQFLERWSNVGLLEAREPTISVIMPVRNRPAVVAAAIGSVLAQTLTSWELIVVDDGSTDDTVAVAERAGDGDPRVQVVRTTGGGAAAARNLGLAAARGRYVAFLDSDNRWVPHFLRTAVSVMDSTGYRAAHAVVERRSGGGLNWLAHEGGKADLLVANHVDLNTLVVDSDLVRRVGGFDVRLRRMIDWDLALRLVDEEPLRLLPFVGVRYDDSGAPDRISVREPDTWSEVVLAKALLPSALSGRVPGRVTVAVHQSDDWTSAVEAALAVIGDVLTAGEVEVVISDGGSRPASFRLLSARFWNEPRVKLRRSPRDRRWALETALAIAAGTGEYAVLLPTGSVPASGTVDRLVAALAAGAAVAGGPDLAADGTLRAAGWGRDDRGEPISLLRGHPLADAVTALPVRVPAVAGGPIALRSAELAAVGWAEPLFRSELLASLDLCVRVAGERPVVITAGREPDPRVGAEAVSWTAAELALLATRWPPVHADPLVSQLWHRRGLVATGVGRGPTGAQVVVGREPAPGLRWAIKIAAPAGPRGETWGDTPFARDLAVALETLGQYVAIDRREAHLRPSCHLDDVVVNIRGLDRLSPNPNQVNILWVISHPDLVGRQELEAWDVVFAASELWAVSTRKRTGIDVRALLQATDPARFRPELAEPDSGEPVLFVGNSRGSVRPILRDALRVGLPVAVYGGGWEGIVPPGNLRQTYLPNDQLGAAYRSAGVVLNDHWSDMAREGFISNRLFDAVAAGARVITDPIPGVAAIFDQAVQVYSTSAELCHLAGPGRSSAFGSEAEILQTSARVRREHSFAARAQTLLAAVMAVRAGRTR